MNKRQLIKLGVPEDCANAAVLGIHKASHAGVLREMNLKEILPEIVAAPESHIEHTYFGMLAKEIIESKKAPVVREPIPFQVWGRENIEEGALAQMRQSCTLPNAVGAALMPDAHLGYGLPIGGVLALDNAVCPYAVGVDIACRMKLSILDASVEDLLSDKHFEAFKTSIEKGTRFGVGQDYGRSGRQKHDLMDDPRWDELELLRHLKNKAWEQLGTSGSGNHFVEYGVVTIWDEANALGLAVGKYTALLSHSGSRGSGSHVCKRYSDAARASLPSKLREEYSHLAWLDLNTEMGQEYWLAMNVMGDYAAANHDVIHRNVSRFLGAKVIAGVENHHNFAWKEVHGGKEMIVHRKGATPAGEGVLGVIPGSMASPAFVVKGKGNEASLKSASHGAGRLMSRKKACEMYNFNAVRKDLEKKRGVHILSAGADEVPYVYKPIEEVMKAQEDLVDVVARFDPKIVKMCGDDSRAED